MALTFSKPTLVDYSYLFEVDATTGIYSITRSFDPTDPDIQEKTLAELCPWFDSNIAKFTVGYLKKRLDSINSDVTQINPNTGTKTAQNCYFGNWNSRKDGYAGLIKLRENNHEFSARIHILLVVAKGYVPPPGFEFHHTCNNGNQGCIGDPFEHGEPQHIVPVPKQVNAAAKNKKCWGLLEGQSCTGHYDNQGCLWIVCPSPTLPLVASTNNQKRTVDELFAELIELSKQELAIKKQKTELKKQIHALFNSEKDQ
jgi:hypothetical protein